MNTDRTITRTPLRTHRIEGGAGTELHVEETGNRDGRPVLFIHGFSQCRLAWSRQLRSGVGEELRLVAMDLRGHGLSGRPRDGYDDSALWAQDVHAVITTLGLERPVLCGWSYGGVVIGDYLRHHGDEALGGVQFVAAVSRLGEPVLPFLGAEFLAALPGLFSEQVDESTAALQTFIRLCTSAEQAPQDLYQAMGYNSIVPPRVRQALLSRTVNHDDLLSRLSKPVLIMHGLDDRVVLPAMSEHLAGLIPHATVSWYEGVGHAPFVEDAQRFDAELLRFASSL